MLLLIRVRELKSVIYYINKYVTIIIYSKRELSNDILTIIKMIIKTHFVDNLKTNMLFKNDVFVF